MSGQNPEIMSHDEIIKYYEGEIEARDPKNKHSSGSNGFLGDSGFIENLKDALQTLKDMKQDGKTFSATRPEKDDHIALAVFETEVEKHVGDYRRSKVGKLEPRSTEALEIALT